MKKIHKKEKKHSRSSTSTYRWTIGFIIFAVLLITITLFSRTQSSRVLAAEAGPNFLSQLLNMFNVGASDTATSTVIITAADTTKKTLDAYVAKGIYVDPNNPYVTLAMETSGMFDAARIFAATDPVKAAVYKAFGIKLADYLVLHKDDDHNGKVGWGLTYAWDAFGDKTINPANQAYTYETGLVGKALVDAYIATRNTTYLSLAKQTIADFLPSSTTNVDSHCSNCRMFWYSTNRNDYGRYVKNTNMVMAAFIGELSTVDTSYKSLARQLYNEQVYEISYRKNYRYYGYNDPKHATNLVMDAHLVTETWGLKHVAKDLGLSNAAIIPMIETFWHCGSACLATISTTNVPISIYGVFESCFFASDYTLNNTYCKNLITQKISVARSIYPTIAILSYISENIASLTSQQSTNAVVQPTATTSQSASGYNIILPTTPAGSGGQTVPVSSGTTAPSGSSVTSAPTPTPTPKPTSGSTIQIQGSGVATPK